MPKVIQNLLETREVKLRRLLDQTSSNKTSSKHEKGIHHTTNSAQNAKTSEQCGSSRSSMNAREESFAGSLPAGSLFAVFMLLRLLPHCSLVLALWLLFVVWWILSSCFDDVLLDDVLSSNLRSLTSLVSNKFWTASGIFCPLASGISWPWILYM